MESNVKTSKAPTPKTASSHAAALEGVKLIERAIEVAQNWPGRLPDDEGEPGGLIMFPEDVRPIIIGDLHANVENLIAILNHDNNKKDFDAGKASLLFIGDSVHDDRTGHMREMDSSIAILDYVLKLIVEHPRNVYYIRGNHDTFDPRLRKSGIAQGLEFKDAVIAKHGADYVEAVGRFFESLPIFVIGNGFVMAHAGPPRGGLVREELINIKRYPEKYHQLMWNRVNEYHGTPSPKEYGESDVRLVLDLLDLPPETQFIVGHNPLWNDGNTSGVWIDVIGIRGHHILYSGSGSKAPYFTREGDSIVVKFAGKLREEVYSYEQ